MPDSIEFDSKLGRLGSTIEQLRELGVCITKLTVDGGSTDVIAFARDPEGYFRDVPAAVERADDETYVVRHTEVSGKFAMLLLSGEKDAEYRKTWGLAPREEDE